MFPSMSSCASTKKYSICRKTWPPSPIFDFSCCRISSDQKLLGGFEWNSPHCIVVQVPNPILVGRQISHSNESVTRVKNSHITHVKKSNEFFTGVTNMCEFFTHLKLDICEKLVLFKNLKICRTYISHIPKCGVLVRIIHSVWKIRSVNIKFYRATQGQSVFATIIEQCWLLWINFPHLCYLAVCCSKDRIESWWMIVVLTCHQ